MAATLTDFLLPQVVLDVISRLRKGRGPLGSWLGFQPKSFDPKTVAVNGPNTIRGSGSVRNVTYRIFDHTRVPLKARAPGQGPSTVAANPMGQNTVAISRFHAKIPLNYEFLGNLSPMIGPNSQIDPGGQSYIAQQTNFLGEQANNMVEMLSAGMMRDQLYFIVVPGVGGDDWLPSFTAPTAGQIGFQVSFGIPAGNKGQLPNQMGTNIGGGNLIQNTWANVGAGIISDLNNIKAAYALLSRYAMTDIWINSTLWANIVLNTSVRNTAGSANTPFSEYEREPEPGMDATGPSNKYRFVLRGAPDIRWHICDDALALNTDIDPSYGTAPSTATLSKLVPDNTAIFCTEPSSDWTRFHHGGEYVVENPGMPGMLRTGYYFWHEYVTQPSAIELIALLNAVPLLYIPAVIAPAQVVF